MARSKIGRKSVGGGPGFRWERWGETRLGYGPVRVGMLGPLAVEGDDGVEIRLTAPKERALLSVLALRAGQVVPVAELKTAVWGDREPSSAGKTLQGYVSSLRRQLPPGTLESSRGGYRLLVSSSEVDALKFERLAAQGAHAVGPGDAAEAAAVLREALMLWRGEPLIDLSDQPMGSRQAARLSELRRGCEEQLAEARLWLGEHATLVGDLESAVAAEPLREKRWRQLMLALYRNGRQADALRAYERLRIELRDQLGIEPGPDVKSLEEAILLQKPELDWRSPGPRALSYRSVPPPAGKWPSGVPPALARMARGTLIGRDEELRRIEKLWNSCDVPALVIIAGEAGIGKTRFAATAALRAAEEGALVLFGRCDEGVRVPYQPFLQALSSYLSDAESAVLGKQLGATGHEMARLLPALGASVPGLRRPTATGTETEQWLLWEAAADLIRAVAADQRVVLVIDDLQWAEPATLAMLRHVTKAAIHGLRMVATARFEEPSRSGDLAVALADLARGNLLETITLPGLTRHQIAALLADRLHRPAQPIFVQTIHAQTGGNAFFAHELVSHLFALGLLLPENGGWPSPDQIERSGSPAGVRHVLSARLSQLSTLAQRALAVAAVAGSEFQVVEVATTMDADLDAVIPAFEEATVAGLVAEVDSNPGGYRFSHTLIRHALYDRLSALHRAQLHWRIAEAIRSTSSTAGRLSELAYHYGLGLAAGDSAIAVEWLLQAGDHARQQLAFEEAIDHYRTALDALGRGPDVPDRRVQLLTRLADVLADFGHLLLGTNRAADQLGVYTEYRTAIEALGLERQKSSAYRGLAQASIQLGRNTDATEALGRAMASARAADRGMELHNSLQMAAAFAMAEGRFAEARTLMNEARDVGGPGHPAVALGYSAQVSALRAELGQVERAINALRSIDRDSPPATVTWRAMLAGLYAAVGRFDEAADDFRALADDRFVTIPRDWAFPLAIRYLAELCLQLNEPKCAGQLLPEVEPYSGQLLVVTQCTSIEGAADRSLAQLHSILGNLDEANHYYTVAAELENSMGFRPLALRTQYWHAEFLGKGHDRQARDGALRIIRSMQSTTSDLGMKLLDKQARQLRARLVSNSYY